VDDDGKDVGANVRQKAKDITNLLQDEDRLRAERRSRGAMRDRMLGNIANSGLRGEGEDDFESPSRSESRPRPGKSRDEDEDLKKAIEESKRMTRDEESKRAALSQE
jgi:epsin